LQQPVAFAPLGFGATQGASRSRDHGVELVELRRERDRARLFDLAPQRLEILVQGRR